MGKPFTKEEIRYTVEAVTANLVELLSGSPQVTSLLDLYVRVFPYTSFDHLRI